MKALDKAVTEILERMLSYNGLTIEQAKEIPQYYSKYTWTKEQENEWKDWAIKHLMKKCRMPKKLAEKEILWFNLNYGFKTQDP
jgi:hypothetical protein